MTSTLIRPRLDQIAELTRGLHLPLPKLEQGHLIVIAESLARAFGDIRERHPATVLSGSEAEVTALLESRLKALLGEDLFWSQLVLSISRGSESLSFDGSHLEKRPDLSLNLSNRDRFPLVIEAKIIHQDKARTVRLYADNGIRRFVQGEYAWARREAMMLAYVRDSSSVDLTLTPLLEADMVKKQKEYLTEVVPVRIGSVSPQLSESRHQRSFAYVNQAPPAHLPGDISLWHLWLY